MPPGKPHSIIPVRVVTQYCPTLCEPLDCSPLGSSVHGIFQARIQGCHFLFQGIFLTQGSNPCLLCLLHCRQILYPLSHRGSIKLVLCYRGIQMILLNPCQQDMPFKFLPVMITESFTEPLKLCYPQQFSAEAYKIASITRESIHSNCAFHPSLY